MHQQQDLLLRTWETRVRAERRTSQRSDVVGRANGWLKVQIKLDLKRRCSVRQWVEVRPALTLVAEARERCATSHSFGLRPSFRASSKDAMDSASLQHANNAVASFHAILIHQRAPD